ncbi:hypothetical protein ABIB99_004843 [Bradyrhizobium sp. LA6.1]
MEVLSDAGIETGVAESNSNEVNRQSTSQKLVFNCIVGLRDTFAKEDAKG